MKAKINRAPSFFKNASGVFQHNLANFIKEYPYMKTTLRNVIGYYDIDFTDPEYIVRIAVKNGDILAAEIGYPDDEWNIKLENERK
jgi:hypothetical protein